MTREELGFVGCRLIALYYAVHATFHLSWTVSFIVEWYFVEEDPYDNKLAGFFYSVQLVVLDLLIALVLWKSASWIAARLRGPVKNDGPGEGRFSALQAVAFAAVGLYLLLDALALFGGLALSIFLVGGEMSTAGQALSKALAGDLLGPFIRMIIGFLLLLGAGGFSGMVGRLRNWGTKEI